MPRPINADVPAESPPVKQPKRRRKPIPAALKAIAGLFVLAIVFILAAILGGRGGDSGGSEDPAPVSEAPSAGPGEPTRAAY